MSFNKVFLIGRLGKDPDVRKVNANTTVCNFPFATNEVYKNQDGSYTETTEWHNIVMWRGIAERAERILKKGSHVFIEGKLRTRSWDDKDGNKRYTTEIVVENFQLLEKREPSGQTSQSGAYGDTHKTTHDDLPPANDSSLSEPSYGDDLPF